MTRAGRSTPDAVVLAGGTVGLLPDADVSVDVTAFEAAAGAALRSAADPVACAAVADRYQPASPTRCTGPWAGSAARPAVVSS
jgi:hypothetical protein